MLCGYFVVVVPKPVLFLIPDEYSPIGMLFASIVLQMEARLPFFFSWLRFAISGLNV